MGGTAVVAAVVRSCTEGAERARQQAAAAAALQLLPWHGRAATAFASAVLVHQQRLDDLAACLDAASSAAREHLARADAAAAAVGDAARAAVGAW